MLSKIVLNYQMLIDNMGELIEISGFIDEYLSKKIGLKPASFLQKKQNGNWTTNEILKLLPVIENKPAEEYIEAFKIWESKKGTFIASAQIENRMKWNRDLE